MEEQKTHTMQAAPKLSVRTLADYFAASDQARRTILRDSKYRPIARLPQHDEAKLAVSSYLRQEVADPEVLKVKADYIRAKIAEGDFERDLNEVNAAYLDRFSEVVEGISLPTADIQAAENFPAIELNGVKVTFRPDLLLSRTSKKTNKIKKGALLLRYAKGKPLAEKVGLIQSAAILGVLKMHEEEQGVEVEKALCLTLDAFGGCLFPAPGNSVSLFNNMKAACATVAECWDKIPKPQKAVI